MKNVDKINNHSLNLSNEYNSKYLSDNVDYNVNFKNLTDYYGPATNFLDKQRLVKEKTSLAGGFRIPEEHLKKRVNPSDEIHFSTNPSQNPPHSTFSFNPYNSGKQNKIETSKNIMFDPNAALSENLVKNLEMEVEKLKKESEEFKATREMRKSDLDKGSFLKENKVSTEYLSSNIERVQAIKHVSTKFKPEYMSLEEVQRLKDEHHRNLLEIESLYYEKKKKNDYSINKFEKIKDEFDLSEFATIDDRPTYNNDELIKTLENKKNILSKQLQKTKHSRAKSAKYKINPADERPLNNEEQRYLRNYMNYQLKKKYINIHKRYLSNTNLVDDEKNVDLWNTTRIRSLNKDGKVRRKDGLPGHLNKEDYSLYYLSISSEGPLSLSFRSVSGSKSASKKTLNLSYEHNKFNKQARSKYSAYKSKKSSYKAYERIDAEKKVNNQQMNSHIAFIKMIFNLIDKQRSGQIIKMDCLNNLQLENNIIIDLGFNSPEHFVSVLNDFPTEQEGIMTEKEFIAFLLSQSNLAGENGNIEDNINEFNYVQNQDKDIEADSYRQYNTENPATVMNELNENSKEINTYNNRLTKDIGSKISNSRMSGVNKEKDNRIRVSYKDFKDFTNQYKTKADVKFTIPKPFEFSKKNYEEKKQRKIQEILEERRAKEDEILNHRFRANELKTHIFVNQFENVIEAEKARRKVRVEQQKQKILQDMKPFSFYEEDEKKFKERINIVSEGPKFLPFKANPIPWTSQVNLYEDLMKKGEDMRKQKIEERARATLLNAKLPPRMELHEKKKKEQDRNMEMLKQNEPKTRSKSFKAKEVPQFSKIHEELLKNLEKKKSVAKPTEPKPFTFHEPKKKASLRQYLDNENDPNSKNPQIKKNIVDIIRKIQQKPKIEPASTKALDLLMAARRKDLEDKQRKEEEKMLEERAREEKQNRLKERVINSKALVDNREKLEETRKQKQEDFKTNLKEQTAEYKNKLARSYQRVYNKPLMFETIGKKPDKIQLGRQFEEKIREAQNEFNNSQNAEMSENNSKLQQSNIEEN